MTFTDWIHDPEHSEHFFDTLRVSDLPGWPEWRQQIDDVLADIDYEDGIQCDFESLIELAGLKEEIQGAIDFDNKKAKEKVKLERIKEDF